VEGRGRGIADVVVIIILYEINHLGDTKREETKELECALWVYKRRTKSAAEFINDHLEWCIINGGHVLVASPAYVRLRTAATCAKQRH